MPKKVVGLIGTGVMGNGMAKNILDAGFPLNVFTRTKARAAEIVKRGATWRNSVTEVAVNSNVIITIVGYPQDVEEVYFGPRGILEHANSGSYLIDMTTSSPKLAKTIYETAKEKQIHALDAPVSGGDVGAQEATLTIMVGGDEEDFETVKPIFQALGKNILHQGEAGAGQHTKMCNQIAIATNMIGVCEAIIYAEKAGLDPTRVLESIGSGAASSWSLNNLVPRMMAGDFAPGFYVKHFIKDMTIALQSAAEMGFDTPGLALAKSLYEQLAQRGEENSGTQALYKLLKQDHRVSK